MPGTKEIRTKIASVKSTQKITKAMQMVATSKMRRAQERMRLARPYAQRMRDVIGHLTEANPDYKHPFLHERDAKSSYKSLIDGINATPKFTKENEAALKKCIEDFIATGTY